MTSKRYVLLEADGEASADDWKTFEQHLRERLGNVKMIPLKGNGRAVVVKTDNEVAPLIRDESPNLRVGERRIVTLLTSGSIGKLKRRASESAA